MENDIYGILATIVALSFGLGIVYVCFHKFKIEKGTLLATILFAPTIFFLGLSGRLTEFKGFGLEAKFMQLATKAVVPTNVKPISTSSSEIQDKSAAIAYMGIGTDVVIFNTSEIEEPLSHRQVFRFAEKIYPGLLQNKFELLVVVDSSNKVLGYFPSEFFFDLLRIEVEQKLIGSRIEPEYEKIKNQLEQTQLWDILEHPKLRSDTWGLKTFIQLSDSNLVALKRLTETNQEAAVVVTGAGYYAGIIRRTDIISELVLALADSE